MRRKKQELSPAETIQILQSCTSGVLAVSGDDGYPYAVPLSYVYHEEKLYFHCAVEGHKLDGIRHNDKVSFCVIQKDEVIPETFTTHFRSAIVFGRARIVTDDPERQAALELLAQKYSPGFEEKAQKEIARDWKRVCVVELKIEHMSGKAAIELVNAGLKPSS